MKYIHCKSWNLVKIEIFIIKDKKQYMHWVVGLPELIVSELVCVWKYYINMDNFTLKAFKYNGVDLKSIIKFIWFVQF